MKRRTPKNFYQEKGQFSFYRHFRKEEMTYGSPHDHRHGQSYHPPAFIPRVNCGLSPQSPAVDDSESWACDYCKVATYRTYDEACNHESSCSMNTNVVPKETSASRFQVIKSRILLCMSTDKQSLSDRQCYVRSQFVEMFEATEADVSARHSKGAQRLRVGQIGIRCMHCVHLNSKTRAERAICFPSSISRIYQTVADMQRFHFEACTVIPETMKVAYKSLKTTRPRGQGSPQAYWIESANEMGLMDTNEGIRLSKDENRKDAGGHTATPHASPISSFKSEKGVLSPSSLVDRSRLVLLPPLSPEGSQSSRTTQSSSHQDQTVFSVTEHPRNEDANMLLALRSASVSTGVSN